MLNKIKNTSNHQKTAQRAVLVHLTSKLNGWIDNLESNISSNKSSVNSQNMGAWTCRELNPVGLGYQSSLANLPSPRQIKYNTIKIC